MSGLLERIWYGKAPIWARPLEIPLALGSLVYAAGMRLDQRRKSAAARSLPRPVLSVGNLTVGGTGKTPVIQFLAQTAVDLGAQVCILSRGYGGNGGSPRRVEANESHWSEVGDEPLLLARSVQGTSVWIGADRYETGLKALEEDPAIELFLLDDGFQHRQLNRDFDLVLIDEARGFGNGRLLPWGPLREPISALGRADRVVLVSKEGSRFLRASIPTLKTESIRIELGAIGWSTFTVPNPRPFTDLLPSTPVRLVSGIGNPDAFEKTALSCGLEVWGVSVFPDHHPFNLAEIERIRDLCRGEGTRLATTAKDAVRLEKLPVKWTEEDLPIIIQLGLKYGDGSDKLKDLLKLLLHQRREPEHEISGGRTSS